MFFRHVVPDRDQLAFLIPDPDMRGNAVIVVKDFNNFTGQAHDLPDGGCIQGNRVMIFVHKYVIIHTVDKVPLTKWLIVWRQRQQAERFSSSKKHSSCFPVSFERVFR